jgi:hypothetical protein
MAQVLNIDRVTVLRHLREKLGFKSYYLPWVLHLLTGELGPKRKEVTGQVIPYLEAARKDDWRRLVTGDEFWLFLLFAPR